MVTPDQQRAAADYLSEHYGISQRRICRVIGAVSFGATIPSQTPGRRAGREPGDQAAGPPASAFRITVVLELDVPREEFGDALGRVSGNASSTRAHKYSSRDRPSAAK